MAGLSDIINRLEDFCEQEDPDYTNSEFHGMTHHALFARYIVLSDICAGMEVCLTYAQRHDNPYFNAVMAKMRAVASITFLPIPVLPFFPWKAPVR